MTSAAKYTQRGGTIALSGGMADMNGYEVVRTTRQEDWGKTIFLIALTGGRQAEDQDKARAGPDGQANTLSNVPII